MSRRDEVRNAGRDELNLVEFPVALIANRADQRAKTVTYRSTHGTLTVSGADAWGLPTAPDADVLVALIALTKLRNGFANPTVEFTPHEVFSIMGWPADGRSYRRLLESMNRWAGTLLVYDGWWDHGKKCRVNATFHMLESFFINRSRRPTPPTSFTWNGVFFKSVQAGYVKSLDIGTYFGLNSSISKQIYRFMDKRMYTRNEWSFDLNEFAFEHVGMSRKLSPANLRIKLKPALDELAQIGFLAHTYERDGRECRIRLTRTPTPPPPLHELASALITHGMTESTAIDLVNTHEHELIRQQLDVLAWSLARKPDKIGDPPAWLRRAIERKYRTPKGYSADWRTPPANPPAPSATPSDPVEKIADRRWASMSETERDAFRAEAIANATADELAELAAHKDPRMKRLYTQNIVDRWLQASVRAGLGHDGK